MQRVAKMNTFYTKNPHADLGESITSGNFSSSRILDLILAAPGHSSQRGCVFVLSNMSHEELSLSEKLEVESMATVQICGPSDQGRFGTSMAVLDFNLDGVDDL
ncbi:Glycosylphosphatidylinositol specific phospholipase D1, partial [Rhizoclosmatium hyalinum]